MGWSIQAFQGQVMGFLQCTLHMMASIHVGVGARIIKKEIYKAEKSQYQGSSEPEKPM